MVSNIVLMKELPDSVRNSAQAYVACLAGAMMKNKYLEAIEAAGFREVKVIEETTFPVEYIVNDPAGKAVVDGSGMRTEDLKEVADGILSVKVSGKKT
jgi:arsenite methyltransferase